MQKLIQDLNQVDKKNKTNLAVPFSEKDESAHPGVENFMKKILIKNDQDYKKFQKSRQK